MDVCYLDLLGAILEVSGTNNLNISEPSQTKRLYLVHWTLPFRVTASFQVK